MRTYTTRIDSTDLKISFEQFKDYYVLQDEISSLLSINDVNKLYLKTLNLILN